MRPPGYIQLGGEVGCTLPQSIHPGMHGVRLQLRRPRCDVGTSATVHSRRGEGPWLRSVRRAARDRNAHPMLPQCSPKAGGGGAAGLPGRFELSVTGIHRASLREQSGGRDGCSSSTSQRGTATAHPLPILLPPYPQGVD